MEQLGLLARLDTAQVGGATAPETVVAAARSNDEAMHAAYAYRPHGCQRVDRYLPGSGIITRGLIEGDRIALNGKTTGLRTYRLDPAAEPKTMDIAGSVECQFSKAIYEIDGDTLKLCFSQSTKLDRPSNFKTEGTRYFFFTLKPAKP